MNKIGLIAILVILVIIVGGTLFYVFNENTEQDETVFYVPNILEPYIRIQKNEELSVGDVLSGDNREKYIYFDIYNYDEENNEYNQIDLIPYVKIELNNDNNIDNLVDVNLYYLKDENLGLESDNAEEITTMGEAGGKFEQYFECKKLSKYNKNNISDNVAHYVAKITLNTETDTYENLTENIAQKFEIILGYKEYK